MQRRHTQWNSVTSSGTNLTFGTGSYSRHAREKRVSRAANTSSAALDPRFRGGDEEEKTGTICSDHSISSVTGDISYPLAKFGSHVN